MEFVMGTIDFWLIGILFGLICILVHFRSTHRFISYLQSRLLPIMEIELHPAVSLLPGTFNVLVAPAEMLVDAFSSHLNLQRYKVLFVGGNYSRILMAG